MATSSSSLTLMNSRRRLPAWAPWAILIVSVAIAAALALGNADETTSMTTTIATIGVAAAVIYLAALVGSSLAVEGSRWAKDRAATTLVLYAFILAMVPLVSLIGLVIKEGSKRFSWEFLNDDMNGIFGQMVEGGAYHAIIGTLYVTGIATAIAVPLGLFTAIYLVEYGQGKLKRAITMMVDVMTGIPSIVAGLFAYTLFMMIFGPAYRSALVGGVALAVLMTPVVVRSVEEMLRLVPHELREASYALGVPKWLTIIKVVLRTAIGGITTGIMIAIARVIGETAPLLITVGIANGVNWNAFDGRIATLPVYVYRQYTMGGASVDRAWAGALTLILIVMLLNLAARLVSRYFAPKGSR